MPTFQSSSRISVGMTKIGRVVSYGDTANGVFSCKIDSLETGAHYDADIYPSPYGWTLPDINGLVTFIDWPGTKRVTGVLHDCDMGRSIDDISNDGVEIPTNITGMMPGHSYIGKYARAYFTDDVTIYSHNVRAMLALDNTDGIAELSGYNFNIHSDDDSIKMYTKNSIPGTFGDSFTVEKCLSGTGIPSSVLSIDAYGAFLVDCGIIGGQSQSSIMLGPTGNIELKNQSSHLSMLSIGTIELFGTNITLEASGINAIKGGSIKLTSNSALDLSSVDLTITGSTCNINATTTINAPLTVSGPLVASGSVTAGPLTCGGAVSVAGAASFTGLVSMVGGLSVVGTISAPTPFAGAFFKGGIPVLVNGIPCVIPCI